MASLWSDFSSGMAIVEALNRWKVEAVHVHCIVASTLQRFNFFTIRPPFQPPPEPSQWIIEIIYDAFFQRNDSIISNFNVFRAPLRTALGDVAVADSLRVS